jgi:hypothetical protein
MAAIAAGLTASAGLAACGGPSDTALVRKAVTQFGLASAKKDYQEICDHLISRKLVETVESVGLPCEIAFKRGLGPVRKPTLIIRSVKVTNGKALVAIHTTAANQQPSDDTLELAKEDGDWKISSLAKPDRRP